LPEDQWPSLSIQVSATATLLPKQVSVYKVGGAVRDQLLGIPVTDVDYVVVGATPEIMINAGYKPVGKDFPVFLHPDTHQEYALARTEKKTAKGYGGFHCYAESSVSLQQDLKRRDLTINAIAQSLTGDIIDPYGGCDDLSNKQLRHVSDAFVEDPVRVLRVARFAAKLNNYGFSIAKSTQQLMQTMADNGEIDAMQPERIWQECYKALNTAKPSVFFTTLQQCGALQKLFPEFITQFKQQIEFLDNITIKTKDSDIRWIALMLFINHDDLIKLHQRLRIPKTLTEQSSIIQHIYHLHQQQLSPKLLLSIFDFADAFRRSLRWQTILEILTLLNLEQIDTDLLRATYEAADNVNPKIVIEQGFSGEQIGEQLRLHRLAAVQQVYLQNFHHC
jgi:tRNA nucleotidyltransferase (CCA-adding enzyme)